MSHLHRHLLAVHLGIVHLTDRTRSNRHRIKFLKHLFYLLPINPLNNLHSILELMLRRILPQHLEPHSHLLTNYIPPMTQILKSFDPNYTRPLDCIQEDTYPQPSSAVE